MFTASQLKCQPCHALCCQQQSQNDLGQIFTSIGHYRGQVVAIRKINVNKIELTRDVMLQLKMASVFFTFMLRS